MRQVSHAMRHAPQLVRVARSRRAMRRFYRQFMSPGDLCFDIGANNGERARVFRAIGATTIAVSLNRNVQPGSGACGRPSPSSRPPSAHIRALSISGLRTSPYSPRLLALIEAVSSAGRFNAEWKTKLTVPLTTLDELIAKYGKPIFCKIDVEGYDLTCSRGWGSSLCGCLSSSYPNVWTSHTLASPGCNGWAFRPLHCRSAKPWSWMDGPTRERCASHSIDCAEASSSVMSMRVRTVEPAAPPRPGEVGWIKLFAEGARVVDSGERRQVEVRKQRGYLERIEHAMGVEGGVRATNGNREVQSPADRENSLQL